MTSRLIGAGLGPVANRQALSNYAGDSVIDGIKYKSKLADKSKEIGWIELQEDVNILAATIKRSGYIPDTIVGVFQGGWIVCQILADHFPRAAIMGASSKTIDGVVSSVLLGTEDDGELEGRGLISQKRVLIVDEVVESGRTLNFHCEKILELGASELKSACLYTFKSSPVQADYYVAMQATLTNYILPWRVQRDAV